MVVGAKSFPIPVTPATTNGPTPGYVALLRGDGASATYDAMVKTQPMVYAAVTKKTKGIARNPLKVYQFGEDGESRQRVRSHELAQLIKKPFPRGSEFALKAHLGQSINVHGHAMLLKSRPAAGMPPTELWPVPWRNVATVEDERGIIGYTITFGSASYSVGAEDVIHVQMPGGSPLAPLRRTLALEDAAMTWQGQSLAQGMTKRGAFVTDQRLSDASIPRLRAELEQLYAGVENAGKVALLEQGLKFQEVGVTAVDGELIAQRRLSREEVCAVYDIAPALLGLERGTYANVVEYRKSLYDAIATDLVLIEATLQSQLIDVEPAWDGLFAEFDTGELLRPDPEARARTHMMNQQAGVSTVNERRRLENLPRIEDPIADAVFVPVNMQPVGEGIEMPAPVADTEAGTPAQGIADLVTANALAEAFRELPAPVVNVLVPEASPRSKRVERDPVSGDITKIIEE